MAPTIARIGGTIERLVRYTTVAATPMPTPISTHSKVMRKLVSARTALPSALRLSCCRETIPPEREPVAFFAPAKISSSLLARGADLEHPLRQRREFGARRDQRVERRLLVGRHLGPPLLQRVEFFLIERPEFDELVLE